MGRYDYPVVLDVRDRLIVIVGGGAVAARKARGLLEAGARRVVAVARAFDGQMPAGVERIEASYQSEHLRGAFLVFAATDDAAVNAVVVQDAQHMGALVSRVDGAGEDHGDFILPAVWRKNNLSVSVSTAGAPTLAARIRDQIGEWIDVRWVAMADAMATVRPIILERAKATLAPQREIFRSLSSDDALETAQQEGAQGVLNWLAGKYPELGLPGGAIREQEEM